MRRSRRRRTSISPRSRRGERDWTRASALLDSAGSALRRTGRPVRTAALPYEHGVVALWRGSPAEAEKFFRLALAHADSGEHVSRYLAQGRLAAARLARGDTADAERWLTTATDEIGLVAQRLERQHAARARLSGIGSIRRTGARLGIGARGDRGVGARRVGVRARGAAACAHAARCAVARAECEGCDEHLEECVRARRVARDARGGGECTAGEGGAGRVRRWTRRPADDGDRDHASAAHSRCRSSPVDSMRNDIARYLAIIQGSGSTAHRRRRSSGRRFSGKVLRRLPAEITDLILVPEDALHRLPFAALIVDGHRVVERFAVHVAPSATIALSLWSARPPPGPARMLAFGDARFPRDDARDPPATRAHFAAFASNGGLTRLSESATEVREAVQQLAALAGAARRRCERGESQAHSTRSVPPRALRDACGGG